MNEESTYKILDLHQALCSHYPTSLQQPSELVSIIPIFLMNKLRARDEGTLAQSIGSEINIHIWVCLTPAQSFRFFSSLREEPGNKKQ